MLSLLRHPTNCLTGGKNESKMNLESLANEVLLELFEYIGVIDLFRAFYGLNSRFNAFLYIHIRNCHLDFRSIRKNEFDLMCKQHLSSIVDRVGSLCLSNDAETPNIIDHFLSYGFTLNRFTHLRSLSLLYFRSVEDINIILNESCSLPHLMHLKMSLHNSHSTDDTIRLMNNIWRLPKLTHCHLNPYCMEDGCSFEGLKIISSSIEYVSLNEFALNSCGISNILIRTPRLRNFHTMFNVYNYDVPSAIVTTSITILNISVFGPNVNVFEAPLIMIQLLSSTPNLRRLTIKTISFYQDGYDWKDIIVNHLPNLKVFRLQMYFSFTNESATEMEVDELLDTFRTPFWINEHLWFVSCEWDPMDEHNTVFLYTLPYYSTHRNYILENKRQIKSTYPNDPVYWSYDNQVKNSSLARIRSSNISYLEIKIPMPTNIWTSISTLDHLTSLELSLDENSTQLEVQTLLDRAPRLYSLILKEKTVSHLIRLKITHSSIRRVCLTNFYDLSDDYLTHEQCSELASSSFADQCQVLIIMVENRSCAIHLINIMPNLRTLIFKCQEDKWIDYTGWALPMKDDVLDYLKDHLPFTYSIIRSPRQDRSIRVWIDR